MLLVCGPTAHHCGVQLGKIQMTTGPLQALSNWYLRASDTDGDKYPSGGVSG